MDIIIQPLDRLHQRDNFNCGVEELNNFIKKYARQNHEKSFSRTFVAVEASKAEDARKEILGFYTLSSGQIDYSQLPSTQRHPPYPVSIARLARLAVELKAQGAGIGGYLLIDALNKVKKASQLIGIFAVVVDSKDHAKSFYEHYGFTKLQDSENTFFIPMDTIEKLIS